MAGKQTEFYSPEISFRGGSRRVERRAQKNLPMKAGEGRAVKGHDFNPQAPGQRGKPYEQLDQLLVDLLLRVRRVEEVYQKRFSRSVRKPRFLINLLS